MERSRKRKQVAATGAICAIGGCGRRVQARGLCHTHYVNQKDGRDLGKIREQRPRLTESEVKRAVAEFQAGKPIRQIAIDLEITKAALQRRLTKAGVR